MAEIEIKVDTSSLGKALRRYEDRTKQPPMPALANLLINEVDEVFQTQGAAGTDGEWDSLKDSTLKRNPRRVGGQILQATGATAAIQVQELTAFSVVVESPTSYAGYHVTGTKFMKKRDFFAIKFSHVLDEMADMALQEYQR